MRHIYFLTDWLIKQHHVACVNLSWYRLVYGLGWTEGTTY